jgi:hypothetical protein
MRVSATSVSNREFQLIYIAYRPYFVTRHKKDVQPHLSPTLLFRNRHHLLSTHHHHQILLLSLSPNQAAMSNVKVILRNAVKASTRSQPKPPFNVPSFSKSHNATHLSREWTATGYAPLRMPVDTDQMETASSIDDMIM